MSIKAVTRSDTSLGYGSVSVTAAVLGGLPPGSVPAHRVTRYGSGRVCVPFF
jgi:hypothetical protein